MKYFCFSVVLLVSVVPAAWPAHAAPPQSTVIAPSGAPGFRKSSGNRHVVTHPATPGDTQPTPGVAGSPGADPNGSNAGQVPNGNNDARYPDGNNNAQSPNGSNSGSNSAGGSPGVTPADE
ncbi:MAG TPA: hypothetical protein VF798_05485 [Burkholderiaceae bacterium]